jgi:ATP-dependent RNA helicase RhlE
MSFASFNFRPEIAAGIKACGYVSPTPIQEQAITPALAGRDVMGLAQTGTGKTAAFVLPMLERLAAGPRRRQRALIVAPTRELAEQIDACVRQLARQTGLRSVTVYGGVSKQGQLFQIKAGAEIVIACPGRLLDHLSDGFLNLRQVEMLVLDEADQMFDMGFLPDIRRILTHLPDKCQKLLFSATMPVDIRKLAGEILREPVIVRPDEEQPPATVTQTLYPVAPGRKAALLLALLEQTGVGGTLVFTRTKYAAQSLARRLAKAGHRAADLQGNLSQARRRSTLNGFRDGTFAILVATDIAARGLDVTGISHVINYDMPATAEAYTHRVGRTGRATRTGEALTFVGQQDLALIRAIERRLGKKLERRVLAGFDYGAPEPASNREAPRLGSQGTRRARRPSGAVRNAGVSKQAFRGTEAGGQGTRRRRAPRLGLNLQ